MSFEAFFERAFQSIGGGNVAIVGTQQQLEARAFNRHDTQVLDISSSIGGASECGLTGWAQPTTWSPVVSHQRPKLEWGRRGPTCPCFLHLIVLQGRVG